MEKVDSAELDKALAGLPPAASYRSLIRAARLVRRATAAGHRPKRFGSAETARIALTGNSTLAFMADPLVARLAQRGIVAEVAVGDYDGYVAELLEPNSHILQDSPEFLIICVDYHAVQATPQLRSTPEDCHRMARQQVGLWQRIWRQAHDACGCTILQTNIAVPIEQPLGSRDSTDPCGKTNFLREINRLLVEEAPSYVSIIDAEHQSAILGKNLWFNEAQWYTTRQSIGFEGTSLLTHAVAATIAALRGNSRKCLVLDLDNTLWGGVVGDSGIENLRIQRGDPLGEAYLDFQSYCLGLRERGVLLAVCSKNEEPLAKKVFDSHPDMVLRLEHISEFVANWENKAENLVQIANRLNLGLDALVFVDDHPGERELVRQMLPTVAVPEMPVDPALYRRVLDAHNYFQAAALSEEDFARGSQYQAEKDRVTAAANYRSLEDFLESLEQKCAISFIDQLSLRRSVQLLNKTNQFNLTTNRFAESEIQSRLVDDEHFCISVRHEDRFGDNGIISIVLASGQGRTLTITDWVMSCRVFNRGIEQLVFAELVNEARRRKISVINGLFQSTDRNAVVANLYRNFGFRRVEDTDTGSQQWRLEDLDQAVIKPHSIRLQSHLKLENFDDSRVA